MMNIQLKRKFLCVQHLRSFIRAADTWKDVLDNPFYSKYKRKLGKVQGYVSGQKNDVNKAEKPLTSTDNQHLHTRQSLSPPPNLNQVMKIELINDKTSNEITKIWVDYHKTKDCISGIIPSSTYLQLHTKATHYPMFVYPLPRNEGYEMWFAQFTGQRCYFTSLINYQMFQENAPLSFTLTYYTEFLDSKGIVLLHGEVDTKDLSTLEAQNLANQMQLYYASQRPDLYAMVRQFNSDPKHFDYKPLIEQLNNISL